MPSHHGNYTPPMNNTSSPMTSELHTLEGQVRLQRLEESITAFLALEPRSASFSGHGAAFTSQPVWETGLLAIHELHHDELFRFAAPPDNQSVGTYFHARFGLTQGDLSDMLDCAEVLIDLRSSPPDLDSHLSSQNFQPTLQAPPPSMDVALAIGAAAHSRHARQQLWAEVISMSSAAAASTPLLPPFPAHLSTLTPFHVQLVASTLFSPSGTITPGSIFASTSRCVTPASMSTSTSPMLSTLNHAHSGQAPCAPVVSRTRRFQPSPRAQSMLSMLSAPVSSVELPSPVALPRHSPAVEEQAVEECNRSGS